MKIAWDRPNESFETSSRLAAPVTEATIKMNLKLLFSGTGLQGVRISKVRTTRYRFVPRILE